MTFQSLLNVTFHSSLLSKVFLFQSFLVHACMFRACVFTAAVSQKNPNSQLLQEFASQEAMAWVCKVTGIPDHVVKTERVSYKSKETGLREIWQKTTWFSGWFPGNLAQLCNDCAKTCTMYYTFGSATFQEALQ